MPKVTSLDPRTPHQPVKLQKLSKNDYGFTPSKIWVNRKIENACALVSIECSWFTGGCSEICAATHTKVRKPSVNPGFSRISAEFCWGAPIQTESAFVKIAHNPCWYC
jgi:hypothetical protein